MNDFMTDLETMSTRKNAAIVSIGAIKFDRHGDIRQHFGASGPQSADDILAVLGQNAFYQRVEIASCKAAGLHFDQGTIDWWMKKVPAEIRHEALAGQPRLSLSDMLDSLTLWIGNCQHPWANGDDFDCAIIEEAGSALGRRPPWAFWNTRDTRTLWDITGLDMRKLRGKNHHHALFDCYDQIVGVQESFRIMKGWQAQSAA